MILSIAETAWHHEGDVDFMLNLIDDICYKTSADYIKLHITLDFDEYMSLDHQNYHMQKPWLIHADDWEKIILKIRSYKKKILLLLNDTKAIEFASKFKPEGVELHSVCLNVPRLQESLMKNIDSDAKIFIGVGGSSMEEIDQAINFFSNREIVLMFGFQNYPTYIENINLRKIRKIQSFYNNCNYGFADHTSFDDKNNELISLIGASNNMQYIEKHVTNQIGVDRCDYSAAISIEMFNSLLNNLRLVDQMNGSGFLEFNQGEDNYSEIGYMKMTLCALKNLEEGEIVNLDNFDFIRTSQENGLKQIDLRKVIGKPINKFLKKGQILLNADI